MKSLIDLIKKNLAHKHLGKEMIGALAINEVRKFFVGWKKKHTIISDDLTYQTDYQKELIEGYVKFNKMFIKTQDQALKIEIFKKKQEILNRINQALAKVGYTTKIVEIIIK